METLDERGDEQVDPRLPTGVAAMVGVLSVVAALAAGHLVAGLVEPGASPYLAVGNTAVDLVPSWLKDFAIAVFGQYDKLALLLGMAVVLGALAVVAGLASRRGPLPGTVLAVVLGLLGVAAVLSRTDLGQTAVLAPLTSIVVGVGVFRWLHTRAMESLTGPHEQADGPTAEHADGSTATNRRKFLWTSAGVAVGAGAVGLGGQLLGGRVDVEASRAAVGALTPATPAPPVPAGADFVAQGTPRFITSNRDFYRIDTALSLPRLRAEDWVLRVHGLVDSELALRFEDIRRRPLVERTVTLACVSNEVGGDLISTADFVGVPLRDLLEEAGVKPGADQVFSTSVDGFTAGTPVADVLDRGLLAIGMNGEPLPVEHGFPARIVVPGLYGYVSATKWLVDLELTTFADREGYWIPRGWAAKAPVKTQSRIDAPRPSSAVGPGRVTVAGVAWAPPRGVAKVEVRADGGDWVEAELALEVNQDSWRMWRAELDLPPGGHVVECRATDRTGRTQTDQLAAPAPDGATGWPSVKFTVRG